MDTLTGWEVLPNLPKRWHTKVGTALKRVAQLERIEDKLCARVRPHMAAPEITLHRIY